MEKNPDLARFITMLLPNTTKNGGAGMHRVLLVFHTGVLLDFIAKSKGLNEGTTALLLAASLDVLQSEPSEAQKPNSSFLQEAVVRTRSPRVRDDELTQLTAACEPARARRPVAKMPSHEKGHKDDPYGHRGVCREDIDETARAYFGMYLWAAG